jgi:hypothetical protein
MGNRLNVFILVLIPLILLNACGKNNPSGPGPAATATKTATSFVPPTITETATVTPTVTVTPTFTVTMTETPFYIDNFADNDIYNNINPPDNPWSSFVNTPDAASNTYTIFDFGVTSAGYVNYGVMIIGTSFADNPDGNGNYFSTYGISTPLLFAPSTGINFNIYSHLIFGISAYVWTPPSAGTYSFKVKLIDDTGRMIEQNISGFSPDWGWWKIVMDISAFTVPAASSGLYTAADVLPNVVEIRWEYGIVSTLEQDNSISTFKLDEIMLEK